MFGLGVMRRHVLPGINPEHGTRRSFLMRAVRLGPRQPPVINAAFLFSANIAIERFRPGHAAPLHFSLSRALVLIPIRLLQNGIPIEPGNANTQFYVSYILNFLALFFSVSPRLRGEILLLLLVLLSIEY